MPKMLPVGLSLAVELSGLICTEEILPLYMKFTDSAFPGHKHFTHVGFR